MSRAQRRLTTALGLFALAGASILLTLGAFELALRWLGYEPIYAVYSHPEVFWQKDELLGWSHTPNSEGIYVDSMKVLPQQGSWLEFQELRVALTKLPPEQREAIVLVGASGMTYEEAADICGCAIGTIKSRVNRGRSRLAELMSIESIDDFGPDRESRAVSAGGLAP